MVDSAGPAVLTPKRAQTRARLLDAAFDVFARVGLGAATIDQIVEHAGYTKGAFYSNFESKTELFIALAFRENARRLEQIRAGSSAVAAVLATTTDVPHDEPTRRDVVGRIVRAFLELQNERPEWLLIEQEARLLAMRDPDFASRLSEHHAELFAELRRLVGSLVESSALRLTIDLDVVLLALVSIFADMVRQPPRVSGVGHPARRDPAAPLTELLLGLSAWADTPDQR